MKQVVLVWVVIFNNEHACILSAYTKQEAICHACQKQGKKKKTITEVFHLGKINRHLFSVRYAELWSRGFQSITKPIWETQESRSRSNKVARYLGYLKKRREMPSQVTLPARFVI